MEFYSCQDIGLLVSHLALPTVQLNEPRNSDELPFRANNLSQATVLTKRSGSQPITVQVDARSEQNSK